MGGDRTGASRSPDRARGPRARHYITRAELAFLALSAVMAALVVWFNWAAVGMQGMLTFYRDFADVIRAGFDPSAALREHAPTFPMWGYGWVFLITTNKLVLLVAQEAFAIFTAFMLVRHVGRTGCSIFVVQALRGCLVVSIPWFATHALLWPYSPSICLVALALIELHRGLFFETVAWRRVVASGLLLGLALNFRSDPILLPVALAGASALLVRRRRGVLPPLAVWLVCTYVCLVPWMLYTRHVTGHALLTSTNGGANLFAGLGNLPGNKWGITMDDSDPVMHRTLAARFGPRPGLYVQYEGDRVLKREFLSRVREDPIEYARKCLYNLRLIADSGCYIGEFGATPEPSVGAKAVLSRFSWPLSQQIVRFSMLLLPLTIVIAWRRGDTFFVLLGATIVYQTLLNMAGGFLPSYTSLVFLFHMANLVYGIAVVAGVSTLASPPPRLVPAVRPAPALAADDVELSILLPVRNETANLEVMLRTLANVVEAKHEALVICDDPNDTSIPVVERARSEFPNVRLVLNDRGRGILNALASGVAAARGRFAVILAADEIGPVLALGEMLALAREGCDFVAVTRYAHGGRRLGGSKIGGLLSRLANALFWLWGGAFSDSTTGIKLFRREVFEQLKLDSSVGWSVAFQMAIKAQLAGLRLGEVPIVSIDRLYGGESSFRLGPWTKQYMKLFLWGVRHAALLRKTAANRVRVRIPRNVSPASPSAAPLAVAALAACALGPWLLGGIVRRLPGLEPPAALSVLAACALAVTLTLLASRRLQACAWVGVAAYLLGPTVRLAVVIAGALALLWRHWERPAEAATP